MRILVIGMGQIGTALHNVLATAHEVQGCDIERPASGKFEQIHICFPYTEEEHFIKSVYWYKEQYLVPGGLCVIHSTVALGTSSQCEAVHSPVRGIHPDLESGIRTFVKYFGGIRAEEAAKIFSDLGIKVKTTPLSMTTEAMKLWDTTIYAWNVLAEKEVHKFCKTYGLDFDLVYRDSNETYNEGYEALGHPEYKKYILKHMEGKIGGHCLIPNAALLGNNWIAQIIRQMNNEY